MRKIEVKNIKKTFVNGSQFTPVLKDISFDVEEGEFVSIMGPSGSGKSTLLYLLGGLDQPTSGQVLINGKDLGKLSDKALCRMRNHEIGFVFQFYNLVPNLSVADNISLPVSLRGERVKKDRLEECLELIGLADKRNLTPRELSGGQQQRVAIARALVFDPDILFLDEPIGNLDTKTGMRLMELFSRINKDYGKTIIQVTHSEEASRYGTKLIRIVDGELATFRSVNARQMTA